ncbi:uncharacterized protein LOC130613205 [Hydractinia symbiolongicarpus]|uniref:uncharacterized protein LOC130613205 n=1 Tax=Hydractinia symbiolongicarpus TaxID=13093 RepID=UPI00254BE281|nr:uncharacterized protein LOC130613205 [Hydractinia symbiolongicarpus]
MLNVKKASCSELLNSVDVEKFESLPYGQKYISDDIDTILDVAHMKNHYVVSCNKDKNLLWKAAQRKNIDPPDVVIYNFSAALIDKASQVPGFENVPVPVMNILMEYGNNYIAHDDIILESIIECSDKDAEIFNSQSEEPIENGSLKSSDWEK